MKEKELLSRLLFFGFSCVGREFEKDSRDFSSTDASLTTDEATLSSEFNEKLFHFIRIFFSPCDYLIFHKAEELFITRRHNRLLLLWSWKIWHGNGEMEFMSSPATSSTLTHPLSSQCENNRLLVHKFNFVLKVRLIIIFVNFPPSLFSLPPIHSFHRFASPTLTHCWWW